MNEIWKDVPGFEGFYSVSNIGRIRRETSYRSTHAGRILKPSNWKYLKIHLSKGGIKKQTTIHSIVLEAFVGKRPEGYHVNHKNGIKHDNRLENLEYCTVSENNKHKFKIGLISQKGEKNANSILKEKDILKIRVLHKRGMTNRQIAEICGVHARTIRDIVMGKSWKHVQLPAIHNLLTGEKK